jgi:polysaccharide pyruvyl transferase WcaK-like protein
VKILILNSDSPNNRGDRAILAGNIKLIQGMFPHAEIWSLSQFSDRDAAWYGINFLPMSPYSVSPLDMWRLARFARRCDVVFWGGGELLKDYTNKIGLVYWLVKIGVLRWFNKHIYGAFQGIGPTAANLSRRMIVAAVNRTKAFLVRDDESRQKLLEWGATVPVVSSFDPASIAEAWPLDGETLLRLRTTHGIDEKFLHNAVGVGLRKWFHYKKSGWLPFRFKVLHRNVNMPNPRLEQYISNVAAMCDGLVDRHGLNVLFLPMHMSSSENDSKFCRDVVARMVHAERTRVLETDDLSPQQTLNTIARLRAFVGARLHSTILATSVHVPSFVFYYVDKGRLYFEQIGMQRFSRPIEDLVDAENLPAIAGQLDTLLKESHGVKQELDSRIGAMRLRIIKDFRATVGEAATAGASR